ncbi:GNAT family N-acetyltransferase [Pseudomonadota bacterium]
MTKVPTIKGSKFILRGLNPKKDKESLWKNINNPNIINKITLDYPYNEEQWIGLLKWNEKMENGESGDFQFMIDIDGKIVGAVGLMISKKESFKHVGKIGYWLAQQYWGQEIVPEAVRLICNYAFKELNLLKLKIDFLEDNNNSKRVAEKNDFKFEFITYKEAFREGKYKNLVYYSKFNPNY